MLRHHFSESIFIICFDLTHTQNLFPKDWIGFYRCLLSHPQKWCSDDALSVWKPEENTNETQPDPLMTASTAFTSDSKFTGNSQTQPSSVPSQRSQTINSSLLSQGCSHSDLHWRGERGCWLWWLSPASCTLLEQRCHFSYGIPPFYTYTFTPMPSYTSPRMAPDITQRPCKWESSWIIDQTKCQIYLRFSLHARARHSN